SGVTPAAQWKIEGHSVAKVDGAAVVTGKHRYASDIRLPGMLFGKVLRPPSLNATLKSADLKDAKAIPGVTVVRHGNFLRVAAPTKPLAEQAIAAIHAEWSAPAKPASDKHLFDDLRKPHADRGFNFEFGGRSNVSRGSIEKGLAAAEHKVKTA